MSNKYYYLTASLPYLSFRDEPPFNGDAFIAECEKWLLPRDMKILLSASRHCREGRCKGTLFLEKWEKFDANLREDLARVRAARKKGESYKTSETLKSVMAQETPLLMEQALEEIRWDFIEDESREHFFDINLLISYFLKIQILERLAQFDKDKGEKFFYSLCEVTYEQTVG